MMKTVATLFKSLDEEQENIITMRRHIHENPELSFEEKQTAATILNFYQKLGMDVKPCGDGYGLIVDIDSGKPGKCLALRADFDALPITENNGLSFESKNVGVMHACGHDGHTAYMMYLAKRLNQIKDSLSGKIRIIHQPAEEVPPGGALGMIKDGCLDGVDNVLGLHVMSNMKTGTIQYHKEETLTGRADFTVTIIGAEGHGTMPQLANDAILASSYFESMVQSIISRRVDPFSMGVVSIGSIEGKGAANIVNGKVELEGCVHYMDNDSKDIIRNNMQDIADGISKALSVKVELNYEDTYIVLYNDPEFTEYVADTIKNTNIPELTGLIECAAQNPAEDFAYYAQQRPSAFIFAGCDVADGKVHPHHSPDFLLDERCLLLAAKTVGAVAINYLCQ